MTTVPGRPAHPDLTIISTALLAADAASESDPQTWNTFAQQAWTDYIPSDPMASALDQADEIIAGAAHRNLPFRDVLATGWTVGFHAGVAVTRGASATSAAFAGQMARVLGVTDPYAVDPESVRWAAYQRAMRVQNGLNITDNDPGLPVTRTAVGAIWFDGLICGLMFDRSCNA